MIESAMECDLPAIRASLERLPSSRARVPEARAPSSRVDEVTAS